MSNWVHWKHSALRLMSEGTVFAWRRNGVIPREWWRLSIINNQRYFEVDTEHVTCRWVCHIKRENKDLKYKRIAETLRGKVYTKFPEDDVMLDMLERAIGKRWWIDRLRIQVRPS